MNTILVGIGEIGVSNKPEDVIKTMALGSCVAIVIYHKAARAAGLAHVALPDSSIGKASMNGRPGYFADHAVPNLLKKISQYGKLLTSQLTVKLIGGANVMDTNDFFNIGKRNVLAIRKLLWKYRLGATAEDVGKNFSRTVWVEVGTGNVFISSPGRGTWQL